MALSTLSTLYAASRPGSGKLAIDKYAKCGHISKRYDGIKGLLRIQAMQADYVLSRTFTAKYFAADGVTRLLWRHDQNQREVDAVMDGFAIGVLVGGVRSDNRGKPILQPTTETKDCESFWMVGGGTLADAVFLACDRDPERKSEQLKATLEQGLENCIVVEYATPAYVLDELIYSTCVFHPGNPAS